MVLSLQDRRFGAARQLVDHDKLNRRRADGLAEMPAIDAFDDKVARMIDARCAADLLDTQVSLQHISITLALVLVHW